MRFSLSIVPFTERGARDPYRRTFDLCRLAEDVGFDTAMIGHHHFVSHLPSDPFVFLAAVAARTRTLRLATAVHLLPLHHPLQVAEQVALLDQISGGRACLGVGIGWNPLEYEAFGARFRDRGARLEEALTVVRAAWTQDGLAHDGRFWSFPAVTVHPRPVQQPHPPIWVAGVAPAAIDRAARLGDAWICDPIQTSHQVGVLLDSFRAACERAGSTPEWLLRRYVWLGSRRDLEERWLPAFVAQQLEYWRASAEGPEERRLFERLDAGERVTAREVAADRFLGGPPDDVVAQLELPVHGSR
jgi:probable F420-dependent oxidoreductase